MSDAALPIPTPEPVPRARPGLQGQASLALVVAAFFFGTTFVVVQDAVEDAEPLDFLTVRFAIAAVILGIAARRRPRSAGLARHGAVAGSILAGGYVFQTVGLQYTTPSTSAFLTYVLVVFVPILSYVVLRQRPHPATLGGIGLAVAGVWLLTGGSGTGLGRGELLTLGCALAFALHIVVLARTAVQHDPVRFTFVQMAAVAGACLAGSLATDRGSGLLLARGALGAAAFTGLFATALAFLAMVWAQRVVGPSRAALILLLEPVFAAALGVVTGDPVTVAGVTGGALVLAAVLVSELMPQGQGRRRERRPAAPASAPMPGS